jgi:hypothetical protein
MSKEGGDLIKNRALSTFLAKHSTGVFKDTLVPDLSAELQRATAPSSSSPSPAPRSPSPSPSPALSSSSSPSSSSFASTSTGAQEFAGIRRMQSTRTNPSSLTYAFFFVYVAPGCLLFLYHVTRNF